MNEPEPSVTTEPQRKALDRMSAELTDKLNKMIAEQEQRVRDFAAQHPQQPLPPMPAYTASAEPTEPAAPPAATVAPPPRPKGRPPLPTPEATPHPTFSRPPAIPTKAAGEEKPEGARINAFTIVIILIVVFFIMSRCD